MTLDELLRIANAAGGTGSGMGTGAPSLPVGGAAPRPALPMPQAVPQTATAPVPESAADASMGAPDFMERLALAGHHNPLISPVSQMADLVGTVLRGGRSGYSDMYRRASIDKLQSQLDEQARLARAKAQAEAAAEAKAEAAARRKQAVAARIGQIDERIKYATALRLALQKSAEASTDTNQLAQYKREAAALDAQQRGWEQAKARLLGLDALDSTIETTMPDRPPVKPKADTPPKEDQGRFITVNTPAGPKMMREAEAAALGYVPTRPRETRTASPSEREHLVGDIGLLTQINRARKSYREAFVGPLRGRTRGAKEAVVGLPEDESSFRSNLAAIRNLILRHRSGGAVTEGEKDRLLEELPTVNDAPGTFGAKMDSFEQTFRTLAENRRYVLSGLGIGLDGIPPLPSPYVAPERPNPSADSNPGKKRKPISSFVRP